MIKYKLLRQDRTTYGGMKWPVNQWNEATGNPKQGLCTDGWLHCYDDPYLALFLNPIHAGIDNPIVCEVEVNGESKNDSGLKRGYRKMRVVKDLNIIPPTTEQIIKFAIYCVLEVYYDPSFKQWANDWLTGKNRSKRAAARAAEAAEAATYATDAAWAAARAAEAASEEVTDAAWTAIRAAEAAADAAWAAARAAADAAWETGAAWAATYATEVATIDLVAIVKKAMGVE